MQQPTMRFCPTCRTDVEDVGGFCMLGHSLKVSASTGDLSTLKAEVDAAFEEAKLEVAAALGRLAPGSSAPTIPDVVRMDPQHTAPVPAPAVARPAATPTEIRTAATPTVAATRPLAPSPAHMLSDVNGASPTPVQGQPQQQPRREVTTPPPPPAQIASPHGHYTQQPVGANDPITAFAPPPHMDWGPQKARFRRRK